MAPMVDRISALPDSLVYHILSFLPTEEAIATSLLSKRWKPMWLAVPTLNLDDINYLRSQDMYSRFIRLVYAVMLSRGEEPPLKEFRLKCQSSFNCEPCAVNIWVKAAIIRCKVEHITLSLPSFITLPFSLFSSTFLVVLKLSCFSVQNNHSSVSFPSLKVLDLKRLHFKERRCLFEIISACPVLEVLVMEYVNFTDPFTDGPSNHFQLPKLVKADISNSNICFPLKPLYNVQFLRIDVMMGVELPTHNLVNLTYMDWLITLLCYCPNLQSLVIDKRKDLGLFGSSDDKNWVHPQCVPKCLLSQLIAFSVKNYEGKEKEFQLFKYIMQNARVLCDATVCCTGYSKLKDKFQMLEKLSLCRRGSDLCQLHFG